MNGVKRGWLTSWLVIATVVIALAIAGVWLFNRSSSPKVVSVSSATQQEESEVGPAGLVLFRDGTTLEILRMHESPNGTDWWRVDGQPAEPDPADADANRSRRATTDPTLRIVDAQYHIYAERSLKFRWFYYDFPGEVRETGWNFTSPTDRNGTLSISLPADLVRGDARIGMAMGGFVTKVTADVSLSPKPTLTIRDAKDSSAAATTQAAHVTFGDVSSEKEGYLRIQFLDFRTPKEQATTAAELAAISKEGKRTVITDSLHRAKPNPFYFTVSTANLRSVVYLTRGIEWHKLRKVAFRPTTQPETKLPL